MGWCPSLLDLCLRTFVADTNLHRPDDFWALPPHLKDSIREVLLKRKVVEPLELDSLLHLRVRDVDLEDQVLTDGHLNVLAKYKSYRKINLNQNLKKDFRRSDREEVAKVTPAALLHLLTAQSQLQTLFLRGLSSLCSDLFSVLPPTLRHLDVSRCTGIEDSVLLALRDCNHLESLSFAGTDISDEGLYHLSQSESRHCLKELRIDKCRNITDEGIEGLLDGLESLEILIFHGCPQVTDRSRICLEHYLLTHRRNVRQLMWTVY